MTGTDTDAQVEREPSPDGAAETPVLRAESVKAGYGEVRVLHDVSLAVREGELLTVLGPNGAGKTTLLDVFAGLVTPTAGAVELDGADVTGDTTHERVSRGVSLVSEERNLFREMTVRENLVLGSYSDRDGLDARLDDVFDLFPKLADRRDQRAASLSGGEAQMLAIGRGLMSEPSVLLLDEPSLGLAPKLVPDLFETVRQVTDDGVPVVLVEQRARTALEVADTGALLENGRIVHRGDADDLLDDERVVETYLGGRGGSKQTAERDGR